MALRISSTPSKRRALVKGRIIDSNNLGIPKSSVVSIRGAVALADSNGYYQFYHYAIDETLAGNPSIDTYLIPVRETLNCSIIYDSNDIYDYGFRYGLWLNGTLPTAPSQTSPPGSSLILTIEDFVGDISNAATLNAMKRGWDGKFGIVYYDRGLRSSAVNTDKHLDTHIPFYTEKDVDDE